MRDRMIELTKQNTTEFINPFAYEYGDSAEQFVEHLIANGVTVQEWISVKDRLPEEDGAYLAFSNGHLSTYVRILRFAKDVRKIDRYDYKGKWENVWYEYYPDLGCYPIDFVTHWMPLPQSPKGE